MVDSPKPHFFGAEVVSHGGSTQQYKAVPSTAREEKEESLCQGIPVVLFSVHLSASSRAFLTGSNALHKDTPKPTHVRHLQPLQSPGSQSALWPDS